ncbi:PIG-L family deacetylase [Methylomonas paludis]|uniref:PIG-L family deacetylase n=1 Tax=Methylomonas paludis TaxID=1173101 RepID=A0A975MLU5_9GAMM|nr:PIG-L family deacetylase [Methylomonas paludis]QWF70182.1 PIG-L family deacetylase [Methylomonas paludis]
MTRVLCLFRKPLLWAVWLSLTLYTTSVSAQQVPQTLTISRGERLLILAPHPDDETLSAAGLQQIVQAQGGSVRSVVVTAGDAYVEAIQRYLHKSRLSPADFLQYGEKRLQESRDAAQLLGKGFIHLDLLGFSDGSIYTMLVKHWQRSNPDRSDFTGRNHVPYQEAEDRGMAQDGEDLRRELLAIFSETRPTIIVFPDVMENDSDHAGLGMFALLAVHDWLETYAGHSAQPKLLAYVIHWQNGWPPGSSADTAFDFSDQPLYLPDDLPLRNHTRSCVYLSPAQIAVKRQALALYTTQQQAMAPFLAAFVHSNECYSQLKAADSHGIENVVKQWQHVRKTFDLHPLTRRKI